LVAEIVTDRRVKPDVKNFPPAPGSGTGMPSQNRGDRTGAEIIDVVLGKLEPTLGFTCFLEIQVVSSSFEAVEEENQCFGGL